MFRNSVNTINHQQMNNPMTRTMNPNEIKDGETLIEKGEITKEEEYEISKRKKAALAISVINHRKILTYPPEKSSYLRLARSKLSLTENIIEYNLANDTINNLDSHKELSEALLYKRRLRKQIEFLEKYQAIGFKEVIINGALSSSRALTWSQPLDPTSNATTTTDTIQQFKNNTPNNILGEKIIAIDLHIKQDSLKTKSTSTEDLITQNTSDLPQPKQATITVNESAKAVESDLEKVGNEIEDHDYTFLSERMPDLPDDEYFDLSEDPTPFHFLKRPDEKRDAPMPNMGFRRKPVVSPIYITIPITINTAEKLPLGLSIGGQEVPLNAQHLPGTRQHQAGPAPTHATRPTKAPNSHFNRLLNHVDSPKRRMTNRHRIYMRKDRHSPVFYKQLGSMGRNIRRSGSRATNTFRFH